VAVPYGSPVETPMLFHAVVVASPFRTYTSAQVAAVRARARVSSTHRESNVCSASVARASFAVTVTVPEDSMPPA
jgi:hypothetical protein